MRPARLLVTGAVSTATLGLLVDGRGDAARHARQVDALGLGLLDLAGGGFWRLVTNLLVQPDPGVSAVVHLAALGVAEHRLGSRRALVLLVGGDWLSTLPLLIAVRGAATRGNADARRLSEERDAGLSAGGSALVGALAVVLAPELRWMPAAAVVTSLAVPAITRRGRADVQHVAAAVVGVALGRRWVSR